MWSKARGEENTETRRKELLEKGYELFSRKSIEAVSMRDVASAVGCGSASIYRYYGSKPEFVVAVANWVGEQTIIALQASRPSRNFEGMSAVQIFDFYLEAYIEMYRKRRDMLRFNQFFNVYIQSEKIDPEVVKPYRGLIERMKAGFHVMYTRAGQDHTVRTDEPEEEMFSTTLHLMLAAVTRYAVGLVYTPESGFDAEKELEKQKRAIMREYSC
ncbi:MAG: TetR/AcrR family transcriptional regulator [Lachnospiraceae bacterium]|nr:TetR/AcrR family transcriptional regulator [Lachnospiraceae bacterium]